MSNKKIVITNRDDKFVTARLFEDDENLVKVVKVISVNGDFESAAKIAVSKLVDSFDWKAFETGTISAKVTKDKFKEFVAEAKKHGFTFKPDENFNPFDEAHFIIRKVLSLASGSSLRDDEIYITRDADRLKVQFAPEGEKEVTW